MQASSLKFVAYLRVSTARQGQSGLGLEAQRDAVVRFVTMRGGKIIAPEFVEVESGKRNDRPELSMAINRCRMTGATLVVAKLDRLSRNAAFLMTLRDSGIQFVAADLPEANTMTVGVMALVAQHEREAISQRTKAALAAARARGTVLGGRRPGTAEIGRYAAEAAAARRKKADEIALVRGDAIKHFLSQNLSLNQVAQRLNEEGVTTSRNGLWTATAVKRMLQRIQK